MRPVSFRIFALLFAVGLVVTAPAEFIVHPVPAGIPHNDDFTVKVRAAGGEWQAVPVYRLKVDAVMADAHSPRDTAMACFDFSGDVEVSVTCNRGRIESARIRPLSYGLRPKIEGRTLVFSLAQPRNLSVEVNGDIFGNLQLFANPIETERPDPRDPNVIYFGPGLHEINTESPPESPMGSPRTSAAFLTPPAVPSGCSSTA